MKKNKRTSLLLAGGLTLVSLGIAPSAIASCLSAGPVSIERKSANHAGIILQASKAYNVDKALIQAVIAVESCFQQKAVSPAGAQGLMQLMPATAERFGVTDSFNAKQNIFAGTRYLQWLTKRFNGNLRYALAGYNAGEGRVDQYNGVPPYRETQKYVVSVLAIYNRLAPGKSAYRSKTIANGTVYFPYAPLPKPNAKSVKVAGSRNTYRKVVSPVAPPKPKALTAKPGRQGLAYMKEQAPHLFKR